jgi:hypothetical protein
VSDAMNDANPTNRIAARIRCGEHARASRPTFTASPMFAAGVTEFTARPANSATHTFRIVGAFGPRVII